MKTVAALAGIGLVLACASGSTDVSQPTVSSAVVKPPPPVVEEPATASASASATAPELPANAKVYERAVLRTLEKVKKHRGLPLKKAILSYSLDRETLLSKTKQKMKEEIPAGYVVLQGESLRALGLIPVDYDLEAGFLKLLQGRVAGFYDPDEKALYLLDDLTRSQEDETLPHELIHALQDQSFSIGKYLDFRKGDGDKTAAFQHVIEGDATLAGLEITYGKKLEIDVDAMRSAFYENTSSSEEGADTPSIMVWSLISPYTDGLGFIKAVRDKGGWDAVNSVFADMPVTTEQTLHFEKYQAHEQALPVPAIPSKKLGADFKVGIDEVNGELGLRLMLQQWTKDETAFAAAAGWGGDRFVVFESSSGTEKSYAVASYTKMDSKADADEYAHVLSKQFGARCKERKDLGPMTWLQRGKDVVIVAGPYTRGATTKSAGDCKLASAWLNEILDAK